MAQRSDEQTQPAEAPRYDRVITPEGTDSLSRIARRIAPGSAVLDVGTGPGALGKYLAGRGCTVDGIENDAALAEVAQPYYGQILKIDLESNSLRESLRPNAYDVVVCADVLEHLRDPGRAVEALLPSIRVGGRLLISIPNVGYAGVVAGLLAGDFSYGTAGILDDTHVRFFTRRTLMRLLREHGLRIVHLETVTLPVHASEFGDRDLLRLPSLVRDSLQAQPDALSYQFIIEAVSGAGAMAGPESLEWSQVDVGQRAQLYWKAAGQSFSEASSATVSAPPGSSDLLEFRLPALDIDGLRLDPTDRPGFVQIGGLQLFDGAGREVWAWARENVLLDNTPSQGLLDLPSTGQLWLSISSDAWVELPVPAEALRAASAGVLRAELRWPSPEELVAIQSAPRHSQANRIAELQATIEHLQRDSAVIQDQARAAASHAAELENRIAEQTQTIATQSRELESSRRRESTLHLDIQDMARNTALRRSLMAIRRVAMPRTFRFRPVPVAQLVDAGSGEWESTGAARFRLEPLANRHPVKWARIDLELLVDGCLPSSVRLLAGDGSGRLEEIACSHLERLNGRMRGVIKLPDKVRELYLDPIDESARIWLGELRIGELSRGSAAIRLGCALVGGTLRHPRQSARAVKRAYRLYREQGWRALKRRFREAATTRRAARDYSEWIRSYDELSLADQRRIRELSAKLSERLAFTIILLATADDAPEEIEATVHSVEAQLFPARHGLVVGSPDLEAFTPLQRILKGKPSWSGAPVSSGPALLERLESPLVLFLRPGERLAPHALYVLADAFARDESTQLAYSDEDAIRQGQRTDPFFKPDWSPYRLWSQDYVRHRFACRVEYLQRIGVPDQLDGDPWLRILLAAGSARAGVHHAPYVLYHLAKSAPRPAGAQHELERHLEATAPGAQVEPGRLPETFRVRLALPASPPLVSIIIPTRDRVELLRGCIESIRARTAYPAYEILVVDNGSTDAATLRYLAQLTQSGQARVIPSPGPFNYAALNNTAARQARGDVLVLLNNDIQIDQPEWLGELVSWALRDDVGIVGCRLRYGNGRLQHVGVTVGLHGLAAHVHRGLGRDDPGSGGMAWTLREAGAVTAACVAIRKAVFDEAGGFEEKLPVAFNDVELCLRIREKGLAALFTPHADVLHLESASRGNDDSPEKQEQTARAADLTRALHPDTTREDPYYNPNLSLESIDAALAFPPRVFRSWRGERADRPRIAFLTYRLKKGYGVDIVVAEQIEYFCARGYQVLVLVLEKDTFFDERLRGYVSAGLLRVQQVASPSEAAQIATSAGSEIAVAHTPPFFTSLREIPTSTLRVILDYGEPPAELFPDTEVRLRIAQEKRAISQEIDLSVAISEFIRRDSGLASSEVCWLGNDHLLRRRGNVKALAGRFRAEHGLHAEFLVLNVTRFLEMERRYKGVDAYAEIRDALVRSHPELADRVRFVLAGRCEPADKAWAEGRGLFAVSNLDDDQLLAAYTDANAYVTMSQWEGCNLGLAQALALGIPSMASARGAHVEFPTISTSNDPQVVADWIAQEVARQSSAGPLTPERSLRRLRTAWSYPWKRSCSQLENLLGAAMQARKLSRHRMPAPLEQESAEAAALQVSFVILNKDKPEFLPACVQSIEQRCKVPFEILIGDTGSTDPETLQFYESTRHAVHYLGFYNFSACNNVLAARARGRYLVFLNNDTKLIEADFAAALAYLEGHPEAGCLGGYLVYADQRIQHAGVRICPQEPYRGIPEHFDRFKPLLDYPGLAGPREVVAVTGALLLVSADRFAQVEGFDEVYVEEAQDIDLCLRLRRQGLNSVMHPALRAYHYENGTRTAREAPHDRAEFLRRFGQTIEDELYAWQEAAGLG